MKCVRIDPDGTIDVLKIPADEAARNEFFHTSVVTCGAPPPILPPSEVFVGYIDDFGAEDLPLNMKAWALYGRSPIFGPMLLKCDSNNDVPEDVVEMLQTPIEEWVPEQVIAFMKENHERPEMLMERPS